MSLKFKIIAGIVLFYSIMISILLIVAGRKLSQTESKLLDYQNLESQAKKLQENNLDLLNANRKNDLRLDSVVTIIQRVDRGLTILQEKTTAINQKYNSKIKDVRGKSQDSLKLIALQR